METNKRPTGRKKSRKRVGRPAGRNYTKAVNVPLTPQQFKLLCGHARRQGEGSMASWFRRVLLEAVEAASES